MVDSVPYTYTDSLASVSVAVSVPKFERYD